MSRPLERGFSMAELLVSMAIFSMVTVGVLTMVSSTHQSYTNEKSKNDVTWQGRAAADLMVRELRQAGYPPQNRFAAAAVVTSANSNLVATTFLTATATNVVFEADLDDDGVVERVEYHLNGTTLERSAVSKNADGSVPGPQYEALATNINNGATALFGYGTDANSARAFPGNVNSVRIVLLVRTPRPDPRNLQRQTLRFEAVAQRLNPER
ncbi:MAG: prepilin-type N-terminal cleavage/methylation domain-containing protein [Acidobacteria bacterium]|nr:prepilin-type N-terminal cleavage/methylation domain-containing protein [Acidobacteriota bacterium]